MKWLPALLASIVMTVPVVAASVDEIAAIEDAALSARRSITAYQITIDFTFPVNGFGVNWRSATYYREGDRLRIDFVRTYAPEQQFPGLTADTYETRLILTPEQQIQFGTQQFPGEATEPVQINRRPNFVAERYADAISQQDIRSIGFHPTGVWASRPIDDLLHSYGGSERQMVDEVINNVVCKKMSLKTAGGTVCTLWIAPSLGYSILRCTGFVPEYEWLDQTDVEVAEWKDSGIWFPTQSTFIRKVKDCVTHHEVATIHVKSLNEPLSAETFEVAGLDVPVGRGMQIIPSEGPKLYWDGEKAVQEGRRPAPPDTFETVQRSNLLLIVNASLLAFVSVFFTLRYLQSRKSPSSEEQN